MPDLRLPDINHVTFAGRLTRDPELRYLDSGSPVCKLGVAVSREYKTKAGQDRKEKLFINVTVWGSAGEWCNDHLSKGSPVHVTGSLTMREWDDRQTGQKRTAIEITAAPTKGVQPLAWDEDKGKRGGDEPIPEDDMPF